MTPDEFAIRLAELVGEGKDGGLTPEELIHALASSRENEAE